MLGKEPKERGLLSPLRQPGSLPPGKALAPAAPEPSPPAGGGGALPAGSRPLGGWGCGAAERGAGAAALRAGAGGPLLSKPRQPRPLLGAPDPLLLNGSWSSGGDAFAPG